MKKTIIYIISVVVLILLSCNEKIIFVTCSECVADEPTTASIELKLEPEASNWVTVRVYRGNIEDSVLVDTFTSSAAEETYTGDVNTRYTFSAEYFSQTGRRTIAFDTAYPRVKFEDKQCDNPCYFVYDNKVNLRIKYH